MATTTAAFPARDAMVNRQGFITKAWTYWFTTFQGDVDLAPSRLASVTLTTQTAAIATTAIPMPTLAAGLYRVSYFARISQAAGTSSSLTVTIGFTHGTVACTISGAAMTGNTTATVQSGSVLVATDAAAPITYSTAFASVGAPAMQYTLSVVAEEVEA